MKRASILAFHDTIESATSGFALAYSTDAVAHRLAVFDQYSFYLTAEQLPGSTNPSISLTAYHSADGMHWLHRPATVEVSSQPLVPNDVSPFAGYDDGTQPLLAHLKFLITLSSVTGAFGAKVRLDVTSNDSRQGAFARRARAIVDELEADDPCVRVIPGGTIVPNRPHSWGRRLLDALAASEAASPYGQYVHGAPLVANFDYERAAKRKMSPILQFLMPAFGTGGHTFYWKLADDARACLLANGGIVLQRPGHGTIEVGAPSGSGEAPGVC